MKLPNIPDFVIIGAGKSGTTSLDNYLKQHPQVFIPMVKEPNFFGYEHLTEQDFAGQPGELKHFQSSVTTLDAYLGLFNDAKAGQVKGETSNTYLYHEHAPPRIKYYNAGMKLIAMLRQPAGRLYSRYLHLARENRLPTPHFEDSLNRQSIWWQRNDLVKEGFYFNNLSRYFQFFPKEQIRVYLYDEFNKNPQETLKDIYGFLGVDQSFETDASIRYNKSGFIRNRFLDKLYGQSGVLTNLAKRMLPPALKKKLKGNLAVQKSLNNLRSSNLHQPKLDTALKLKVTNDVYREDILKLQDLLQRDLTHWLT